LGSIHTHSVRIFRSNELLLMISVQCSVCLAETDKAEVDKVRTSGAGCGAVERVKSSAVDFAVVVILDLQKQHRKGPVTG